MPRTSGSADGLLVELSSQLRCRPIERCAEIGRFTGANADLTAWNVQMVLDHPTVVISVENDPCPLAAGSELRRSLDQGDGTIA